MTVVKTGLLAGAIALISLSAAANPIQLARKPDVEPGRYSTAQRVVSIERQRAGGRAAIDRIPTDLDGGALVPRLSTTHG